MKSILLTYCFAFAALIGMSQEAMAVCTFTTGQPTTVMPLQGGSITVGRDVPLGGIVYQQGLQSNLLADAQCRSAVGQLSYQLYGDFITTPRPLSNLNTGPFANRAYETGVPGLGVVILVSTNGPSFPFLRPPQGCGAVTTCVVNIHTDWTTYRLVLVKTANIVGSGVISGSNLPSFRTGMLEGGVKYPFLSGSVSGNINVVSRTCQTPNVEVDMGVHKVSEFAQVNSATPWKDFSISLNNCPAFFGKTAGAVILANSNGSGVSAHSFGAQQSNTIQVNLLGTVPPINASQGILALDPGGSTSGQSATGVGVQVANNAGTPVAIGPGAWIASGIITQAVDGMSYTVPLKARYLRTAGPIGPGQANATVQFTINYQ